MQIACLRIIKISPDGKYYISAEDVKIMDVYGNDFYKDLPKSNAQVYNSLMYRHWDEWEDGKFSHIFFANNDSAKTGSKDIMPNEAFDCPQKPLAVKKIIYGTPMQTALYMYVKRKTGTAYTLSTNTDLYEYDLASGTTKNLTEGMMGYDINPAYNSDGQLAWLSQQRDGYEADKQDIVVMNNGIKINLTRQRDDINVESFKWSDDNKTIYFIAPIDGTLQLFSVSYPGLTKMQPVINQLTHGNFDISSIVGQAGNSLIVTKTDFNHAAEIYSINISNGGMEQLTHINDDAYKNIAQCSFQKNILPPPTIKK